MSARERVRRRRRPRRERRRAIFLLPNLITTASLLLGFWSIVQSIEGRWNRAAWGIIVAGIADMLDGRIARATRSTSRFGIEYDSLADVVSFGIAPALLVYSWALRPLGERGWLVAVLFAVCAALRLARFNVQVQSEERDRYQGLPSTIAGGFVAVTVWFLAELGLGPPLDPVTGLAITGGFVLLALLMVSSIPYPSWKSLPTTGRNAFTSLVALSLAIVLVLLYREPAFFALGVLYVSSGPVLWLASAVRAGSAHGAPDRSPEESIGDGG